MAQIFQLTIVNHLITNFQIKSHTIILQSKKGKGSAARTTDIDSESADSDNESVNQRAGCAAVTQHALFNSFRLDDSDEGFEADDESEPDQVVVDSEGSDELVLVPEDDSGPASEGNSSSEMEDPQPVVVEDLVCDAPNAAT